jgi:hypothetical protein
MESSAHVAYLEREAHDPSVSCIRKPNGRSVAAKGAAPYGFGVQTNNSVLSAGMLLSVFVSNAFAVLRPTRPDKLYPADPITIGKKPSGWVWK